MRSRKTMPRSFLTQVCRERWGGEAAGAPPSWQKAWGKKRSKKPRRQKTSGQNRKASITLLTAQEKLIPQEMENNLDQEPNSLRQCSTSAGNLGVLRTFVYSEEETIWIHDNHCDLTIKSDTSLQLLRCLLRKCLPPSIIWSFLEDNPACKQEWPWLTVCHTYRETTAVSSNREAE